MLPVNQVIDLIVSTQARQEGRSQNGELHSIKIRCKVDTIITVYISFTKTKQLHLVNNNNYNTNKVINATECYK